MAISYPVNLPSVSGISSIRLIARNIVAQTESPFTFKQQIVKHAGERWEADITLSPMKRPDAEEWNAFILSLGGKLGTFLLGDPLGAQPRGSASSVAGTPRVNGSDQTGNVLAVDGLPPSQTSYLLPGDYIQLGGGSSSRLHKVLRTVASNSSGQASIDIWPALRESPSDNAFITVTNAKGLFRLASNENGWDANNASIYGITFGAVEAI